MVQWDTWEPAGESDMPGGSNGLDGGGKEGGAENEGAGNDE